MQFTKATKKDAKLRLSLIGPSGSGKTYTALALASNLTEPVALIDTERGSAAKYATDFDFDVLTLDDFHPRLFIDAINAAVGAGYGTLIIDSLSHAWMGKNGALELVDKAQAASKGGNSFTAWKSVTPIQMELVDAILRAPLHIIATMRAKTEYVVEQNDRGKSTPRKVGTAPVQRDGIEYEFDVVADLDQDNNFIVTKTRCPQLQGQVFKRAGADVAGILTEWLQGTPEPLATEDDLRLYSEARDAALMAGLRTPSGNEFKVLDSSATQADCLKRTKALEKMLDNQSEAEAGRAAADAAARDTANEAAANAAIETATEVFEGVPLEAPHIRDEVAV